MDAHTIEAGGVSATIRAQGAELCSLQAGGVEFMWQAGPVWPRHAPLLFPIVGRLAGDTLRHAGIAYRMTQHGFARDQTFEWLERGADGCRLVLRDSPATRATFPFGFTLEVGFHIAGGVLDMTVQVGNPGPQTLPASVGLHPAFAWPLRDGVAKTAHSLTFEQPEPDPIRRVGGGLLLPEAVATPIAGRVLALDEALFAADALILEQPASRHVTYAAPGGPSLEVGWRNCPQLGIWSKPGDFVCIEPWHGFASPADWDGEFREKPGLMLIAAGDRREIGASFRPSASTPQ